METLSISMPLTLFGQKLTLVVFLTWLLYLSICTICLQKKDEAYFMSLLRIAETTCGLYYSYDRDLTLK